MLQALLRQSLAKGGRRAKGSSLFALRHLGLGGPFKGKNNHQRQQTRNKFTEVSTLLQHIPHHSNPKINELVKQYLADERNKTQSGDPGPDVVAPAPEGAHQSSATVINRVFTNNALALKRIDVIGCGKSRGWFIALLPLDGDMTESLLLPSSFSFHYTQIMTIPLSVILKPWKN